MPSSDPRPSPSSKYTLKYSVSTDLPKHVNCLRSYYDSGETRCVDWRYKQLKGLLRFCIEEENNICNALKEDSNKSRFEVINMEIAPVIAEIKEALSNLKSWMSAQSVSSPITVLPGSSYIISEPYGVALIISPFNYPILCLLSPLVSALSAGNVVMLKPSELTVSTTKLFMKQLPQYLDEHAIKVVTGAVELTRSLLLQQYDYIFFTGSERVGKIVARAAAEHLTPITLELGGQSPTIVHSDADITLSAKRIICGRIFNAGQTCVAPNHVFVHENCEKQFIEQCIKFLKQFYYSNNNGKIEEADEFGRIINTFHTKRLIELLQHHQQNILFGGRYDENARFIEPTLIKATEDSKIMESEIFGPILPIISYQDINHVIEQINNKPKPLALYIFGKDEKVIDKLINETSCGGISVNDVIMHLANTALPFGGVGSSGMGSYHGKYGFDTFSHKKPVLRATTLFDPYIRYPPFREQHTKILKWLITSGITSHSLFKGFGIIILLAIAIALVVTLTLKRNSL